MLEVQNIAILIITPSTVVSLGVVFLTFWYFGYFDSNDEIPETISNDTSTDNLITENSIIIVPNSLNEDLIANASAVSFPIRLPPRGEVGDNTTWSTMSDLTSSTTPSDLIANASAVSFHIPIVLPPRGEVGGNTTWSTMSGLTSSTSTTPSDLTSTTVIENVSCEINHISNITFSYPNGHVEIYSSRRELLFFEDNATSIASNITMSTTISTPSSTVIENIFSDENSSTSIATNITRNIIGSTPSSTPSSTVIENIFSDENSSTSIATNITRNITGSTPSTVIENSITSIASKMATENNASELAPILNNRVRLSEELLDLVVVDIIDFNYIYYVGGLGLLLYVFYKKL